jgi:hypothetical protein
MALRLVHHVLRSACGSRRVASENAPRLQKNHSARGLPTLKLQIVRIDFSRKLEFCPASFGFAPLCFSAGVLVKGVLDESRAWRAGCVAPRLQHLVAFQHPQKFSTILRTGILRNHTCPRSMPQSHNSALFADRAPAGMPLYPPFGKAPRLSTEPNHAVPVCWDGEESCRLLFMHALPRIAKQPTAPRA